VKPILSVQMPSLGLDVRVRCHLLAGMGLLCLASATMVAGAAPPTIPARVQALATNASLAERQRAFLALRGQKLEEAEVSVLQQYLLTPDADDGSSGYTLKDVLLVELERQRPAAEMVILFEQMFADRRQHVIMRDFAIQHAPVSYETGTTSDKQRVVALLRNALRESDSQIAGTALLAVARISGETRPRVSASLAGAAQEGVRVDRSTVAESALTLASNTQASPLTRATAIQVCARLKLTEALPVVAILAQSGNTIPLRIAAIAALADLGNTQHYALLQQLTNGDEPRLRPSVESALKRMRKRLQLDSDQKSIEGKL
jgi:hypothetical protein